jgi:hypothetical protein
MFEVILVRTELRVSGVWVTTPWWALGDIHELRWWHGAELCR